MIDGYIALKMQEINRFQLLPIPWSSTCTTAAKASLADSVASRKYPRLRVKRILEPGCIAFRLLNRSKAPPPIRHCFFLMASSEVPPLVISVTLGRYRVAAMQCFPLWSIVCPVVAIRGLLRGGLLFSVFYQFLVFFLRDQVLPLQPS